MRIEVLGLLIGIDLWSWMRWLVYGWFVLSSSMSEK